MTYEAALAEPFVSGLTERVVRLPRCGACGRFHWYPMRLCPHCRADRISWQAVEAAGTVFTVTTVRHGFAEDLQQTVPYTVALVELADAPGVRLLAEIEGDAVPQIGDAVAPVYRSGPDGPRLLYTCVGVDRSEEGAR